MRRVFQALVFVFVCLAMPVTAQSWSSNGKRASICPTGSTGPCAVVTCETDGQVYFYVRASELRGSGRRTIDIPGQGSVWSDPTDARNDAIRFEFNGEVAEAINWLKAGSRFTVSSGSFHRAYSLRGSSAAIGAVQSVCARLARDNAPARDPFAGSFMRFNDEADVDYAIGEISDGDFQTKAQTDLPGYDLRTGLTDPTLANLTPSQCATLCLSTQACTAITVNNGNTRAGGNLYYADEGVCFLKAKPQRAAGFRGAISAEIVGSWSTIVPPPTPGPGLTVRADAAARPGEDAAATATRLREISKPIAGTCAAERASVEALAKGFDFSVNTDRLTVGAPLTVSWSGNTLQDRIPVWAMVSVDRPVRFGGSGFYALGPDSPNPFAIKAGAGSQRALTALFARGSA